MNDQPKSDVKGLSKSFLERVGGIVNDKLNEYELTVTLSYTNGPTFTINPEYVTRMRIIHDYADRFRENVFMTLKLPLKQATVLATHKQDLIAEVKINTHVGNGKAAQPLFSTEYIVVLHDMDNLELRVNTALEADTKNETLIELEFNLIQFHDYHLSKKKFSTILHNATMLDAIHVIAQILELHTVFVVPPQNTKRYKNLIIPALSTVADVFGFLQESNGYDGVYMSGMGYFIQHRTLYVYPKNKPLEEPSQVNFFNVGPNSFIGMTNYHSVRASGLNIVLNQPVKVEDTSRIKIESLGNWFAITKPKQVLHDIDEFNANGKPVTKSTAVSNIMLSTNKLGVTSDAFTMSYYNGNNAYAVSQALYANGISKLMLIWPNACPYLIRPNLEVHYVQDKPDGDTKATISSVIYAFTRSKGGVTKFNCVADITLAISAHTR